MTVQWRVKAANPAGEGEAVWDTALWDTGLWSGTEPVWTDLSAWCLGFSFTRGRRRFTDQFATGYATIRLDNDSGIFNQVIDPGGVLRPGRWVQIDARVPGKSPPLQVPVSDGYQWNGSATGRQWTANGTGLVWDNGVQPVAWEPQFTGYVDEVDEVYAEGAGTSETVLSCYDFQAIFNQYTEPPIVAGFAGDLTGTRINRLLDDITWDPVWRRVAAGRHTMSATTLSRSYLAEMRAAAAADGDGGVFIGKNGYVVFEGGDWRDSRSEPVLRIGATVDKARPVDAVTDWAIRRVLNDAQITPDSGVVQRAANTQSQGFYGRLTFAQTLQLDTDADALTIAGEIVARYAWDSQRVDSVEVYTDDDDTAQDLIDLELLDRVGLVVTTLPGWAYAAEVFVNEIRHTVNGLDWQMRIRVDAAEPGAAPGAFGAFSSAFSSAFDVAGGS